jgi:hypothetical protein
VEMIILVSSLLFHNGQGLVLWCTSLLYYPITGNNGCDGQWAISYMLLLEVSENVYDPPLFFKQLLSCFIFLFSVFFRVKFPVFPCLLICCYYFIRSEIATGSIRSSLNSIQVDLYVWRSPSTYEDISSYSFRTEVQNEIFATTMAYFQASRE